MNRIGRTLVFLSIVLSIWGGMHYFVWTHLARHTALPAEAQSAIAAALAVLGLSTFLSILRVLPAAISGPLWRIAFTWAGTVFLLFFLFLIADIVRGVVTLALPAVDSVEAGRIEALAVLIVGVGLAAYASLSAAGDAPVKRIEVALAKWPEALSGFSIVQISDLHVSPDTHPARVRRLVERANGLSPDLLALTGDLVDGSPELLKDRIAPLAGLKAKHGTWFVTGNHEYFSGADRWIEQYRAMGFKVLQNERVTIGSGDAAFELAGVPDWRGGSMGGPAHAPRLEQALKGVPPEREVILLAHQPRQFPEAAAHDVGLQLSGHTHGGQIWPFTWLIHLAEKYVVGLHRIGRSQLYVSRGTGYWGPPMRLFAPPELTVITLKRG